MPLGKGNTPTGKISRLPHDLRSSLNLRLRDGEGGKALLEWLNSQPALIGKPKITAGHLYNYRQRAYARWLERNPLPRWAIQAKKAMNFKAR